MRMHDAITMLKRRDAFSGVRYEVLVAGTLVRAGFSVEPEDEALKKTHPESVATHKAAGFVVAPDQQSDSFHPRRV